MRKSTITREQITSWMNDASYALEEPLNADNAAAARAILAMGHELLAAMDQKPALHRYRRKAVEPYGPYPWHYEVFVDYPRPVECIEDEYFYAAPPLVAGFAVDGYPTDDERIMAIEGIIKPIWDCDTPVYPDAEKRIADAVDLLKQAAPGMLADHDGPDGPMVGRMKQQNPQDGYVMVPKEATLEMIKSGASAASNGMLIPGIYKAMLAAAECSIPMISDRWIPVSEQMPEIGDIVLTAMGGVVNVGETECSAANCRFFTSVISGRELPATHWMPLPVGPME